MAHEPTCIGCYNLIIDYCGDELLIPVGFPDGTIIHWQIKDKFGEVYRGSNTTDTDGNIGIEVSRFPDGLFTPYSGIFVFTVLGTGESEPTEPICEPLEMTICAKDYNCIKISFASINITSPPVE